jgi:type II secretory ATPase GspE/PulE/Tfp pilus assembly ATPase PilB-like protein
VLPAQSHEAPPAQVVDASEALVANKAAFFFRLVCVACSIESRKFELTQHVGPRAGESQQVLPHQGSRCNSLFRGNRLLTANMMQLKMRLSQLMEQKKTMQALRPPASKSSSRYIALEEGFRTFGGDLSKLQVHPSVYLPTAQD